MVCFRTIQERISDLDGHAQITQFLKADYPAVYLQYCKDQNLQKEESEYIKECLNILK